MKTYTSEEFKKYLDVYLTMISYSKNYQAEIISNGIISLGEEIIKKAKNEFPEELKDKDFYKLLKRLENIIEEKKLENIIEEKSYPKFWSEHCDS